MPAAPHLQDHRLAAARALIAAGHSQASTAAMLGLSAPTLCRWLNASPAADAGRKTEERITPVERETLKRLYLQTRSRRIAAEDFLHDPACSHETAAAIQAVLDAAATSGRPLNASDQATARK